MGAITGASKIPPHLIEGLHAKEEIAREIDEFVDLALAKLKSQHDIQKAALL